MNSRPNTGKSPFEEEKEELVQRYVRISSTDAAPGWNKQYDMTLEKCIHGANCQSANKCRGDHLFCSLFFYLVLDDV